MLIWKHVRGLLVLLLCIFLLASCSLFDSNDDDDDNDGPCALVLTYPNGGETWQGGSTQMITWASTGDCNDIVEVELHRAGSPCLYIDDQVPNTGSFTWDAVEQYQDFTDDYRILVYDRVNDAGDTSDDTFNILPGEACSITLTYPNGGEAWTVGSSQTINWTSTGDCNDFVEVELHRAGEPCIYIDDQVPNTGSFIWESVAQYEGHQDDYRILVYDRVNDAGDTSDDTFTIMP